MLWIHTGNSQFWIDFADLGELLAAMLATVACAVRAKGVRSRYAALTAAGDGTRRPARRHAWSLLAIGVGLWATGQLAWCIYEIVLVVRIPEPSLADPFYLAGTIVLVAGLLAFVRTPAGHLSHLRGAVEALCIACGFLLCTWTVVIGPVLPGGGPNDLGDYVNLAYPILDAVALGAVFFVALRRRNDPPAGLTLLAAGIILWMMSDSARWFLVEVEPHLPGVTIIPTGWVAGFSLIAFAAWRAHNPRPIAEEPRESRFVLALPALPGLGGVLIVISDWLVEGSVHSSTVVLGIMAVFVILALTLLVIVIYENDALTRNLERRVRERTAELDKTERYYRALVQHSSDLIIVLDPDLRLRYVSNSCESVFGFAPRELVGQASRPSASRHSSH